MHRGVMWKPSPRDFLGIFRSGRVTPTELMTDREIQLAGKLTSGSHDWAGKTAALCRSFHMNGIIYLVGLVVVVVAVLGFFGFR
jgi:hypothetical protein